MSSIVYNEDGATALEYGLLAALVCMAIVGSVMALGLQIGSIFTSIVDAIESVVG